MRGRARESLTAAALLASLLVAPLATPASAEQERGWAGLYADLLEEYTRAVPETVGTRVDYPGLLAEPRWKELVEALAAADPGRLESRAERLAFWINAYNVLAIEVVLGAWPVKSIRDAGSFFSPVWKKEAGRIGGRGRSLDEIEHRILRPMGEPRIHAAIVCASVSCPSLRREPFEAERLDAQLDEQLRDWLADPRKGSRLGSESGTLTLSKIFEWFGEDFEAAGGVLTFVEPYLPEASRSWLAGRKGEVDLAWFDYDWSVNQ